MIPAATEVSLMVEATRLRDLSDLALVECIREGREPLAGRAVVELFGRYRQRVYQWCRRYADHEDALDLAQDVLLIAFRSLHTYEGRAPFGAWLFTITHRRCLRALRRRLPAADADAVMEELPDVRRDPESQLEEEQDREALLRFIGDHLDPVEQRAVWLRYVEELPVEDITRTLRLTNATGARGLLQTARRKLRAARERGRAGGEGAP